MPTVFSVLMITVMQCTVLNVTYDSSSQAFVCPKGDYLWPESTWGMKLGFSVGNIRNKGKGDGEGVGDDLTNMLYFISFVNFVPIIVLFSLVLSLIHNNW